MNLNHLQKFVNTIKAGSITKAANEMDMPKSSLSRQLSQLETEMSIKLLERRPRNLTTTEAGKQLFDQVEPLLTGIADAEDDLNDLRTKPKGPLSIQVPTESMGEDISSLCLAFLAKYPEIQLSITHYTDALPKHPEDQDVCFVFHDTPLPDMDVVASTLASFPQSIYTRAKDSVPRTIQALDKEKLILRAKEDYWHFRSNTNKSNTSKGISLKTKPAVILDSHEMRVQACISGFGLARFSDYSVEQHVGSGKLVKVDMPEAMMALCLSVLYRHRQVPRKVQIFVDFIQSHFGVNPMMKSDSS